MYRHFVILPIEKSHHAGLYCVLFSSKALGVIRELGQNNQVLLRLASEMSCVFSWFYLTGAEHPICR